MSFSAALSHSCCAASVKLASLYGVQRCTRNATLDLVLRSERNSFWRSLSREVIVHWSSCSLPQLKTAVMIPRFLRGDIFPNALEDTRRRKIIWIISNANRV
jgi:hypothetical protein